MSISLEAAAQAYRDAMQQTVKRFSLWYLIEGLLLVVAGILAVVFPVVSSAAAVIMLGWLLIVSGIVTCARERHPHGPRRTAARCACA